MKALLFLGLLACAIHSGHAEEFVYDLKAGTSPSFPLGPHVGSVSPPSYQIKPWGFRREGTVLIVHFDLQQAGDFIGRGSWMVAHDAPWRSALEGKILRGELTSSYYTLKSTETYDQSRPRYFRMAQAPLFDTRDWRDSMSVRQDDASEWRISDVQVLSVNEISPSEFWTGHAGHAEEFVYDLRGGDFWLDKANPDRFVFSVRQQGEETGTLCVSLPPDHPWRKLMEARKATGDLEFSYFRIRTEVKLYPDKALSSAAVVMPSYESGRPQIYSSANIYQGSSIVTQETMQDMAKNSQYQLLHTSGPTLLPVVPGTSVKEWSEITQNQFLNINPRKVKPPEDAD